MKCSVVNLNENGQPNGVADKPPIQVCKFVVFASPEEQILIFGPVRQYHYHAALVRSFCQLREIPSGWEKQPDLYQIYDRAYKVSGGGWLDLVVENKSILFYDRSTAYGGFDPDAIIEIFDQCAGYSEYKLLFQT
ncbi:MAG: hypothetical protein KAU36_04580 [candidate division Zixibacteria bacterium]|nr:hypothetical protein [candidate division Zixibacteria bacterium]